MRVDEVMRDRADLVPVEPPVKPLAGSALDRIEEEQGPFSAYGLTLDSLHESETDALPPEVAMNEEFVDFGPVWRVRLRRKIKLNRADDTAVYIGTDEQPFAFPHRTKNILPMRQCLRLIERKHEADERAVFDALGQHLDQGVHMKPCLILIKHGDAHQVLPLEWSEIAGFYGRVKAPTIAALLASREHA
ncbi:hypothetical protein [Mesorhizobium sp. WSM4303]|uniref:hypothetical protein n=1 Tax=Mesorhizobium sp. WSM4303 TaxID=2589887 RepID=UPI001FEDB109|nr:hypothetical protein [Mesorhizobium sp. WSM4303]